jgi:hypothetical protein
MGLFTVVLILTIGYGYAHANIYYHIRLHSFEGQHLYFLFARLGLLFVLIGSVFSLATLVELPAKYNALGLFTNFNFNAWLQVLLVNIGIANEANKKLYSWMATVAIISSSLPFIYVLIKSLIERYQIYKFLIRPSIGRFNDDENPTSRKFNFLASTEMLRAQYITELLQEKLLTRMIVNSAIGSDDYTVFVLNDNSFYVGSALQILEPSITEAETHFPVLVASRGHCDKDTLELVIDKTLDDDEHYQVVISFKDIKTVFLCTLEMIESDSIFKHPDSN